jgi:hypothetical protein
MLNLSSYVKEELLSGVSRNEDSPFCMKMVLLI